MDRLPRCQSEGEIRDERESEGNEKSCAHVAEIFRANGLMDNLPECVEVSGRDI